MKRKSLSLTLCLLTCLALIGVGFAAWVVSAGDTKEVTGNITVDTVTDARYKLELAGTNNLSVYFGKKNDASITNPWLANPAEKEEALTVSFEVTVKKNDGTEIEANIVGNATVDTKPTLSATFGAPETDAWKIVTGGTVQGQTSYNLINAPSAVSIEKKADTTSTYTVTVTFAWGDYFKVGTENVNPYIFYNNKNINDTVSAESTTTWGDDALAKLGLIAQIQNSEFTVTLTLAAPTNVA